MCQITSDYLSSKKPGWSVMFQNVVVFSTRDRYKRIRLKHEKVGAILSLPWCVLLWRTHLSMCLLFRAILCIGKCTFIALV